MREETRCRHIGYSFRLAARVLLYASSNRQDNTYHDLCYTSCGALAGSRNSSMGLPWRIDPTIHPTMSERSYHGATSRSVISTKQCFENVIFSMDPHPFVSVSSNSHLWTGCWPSSFWILLSGPSCSLGYFPFQPVVHNWFIKGRGMYCSIYGKVHIKDPLLLIEKSSLCGGSGFPSKKCVNVTIWMTSNNRW